MSSRYIPSREEQDAIRSSLANVPRVVRQIAEPDFKDAADRAFPAISEEPSRSLVRLSEEHEWDDPDAQRIARLIKSGMGPFLDNLFNGTRCWNSYCRVRLALVRTSEMEKATSDYTWSVYKVPQIMAGSVFVAVMVLAFVGLVATLGSVGKVFASK